MVPEVRCRQPVPEKLGAHGDDAASAVFISYRGKCAAVALGEERYQSGVLDDLLHFLMNRIAGGSFFHDSELSWRHPLAERFLALLLQTMQMELQLCCHRTIDGHADPPPFAALVNGGLGLLRDSALLLSWIPGPVRPVSSGPLFLYWNACERIRIRAVFSKVSPARGARFDRSVWAAGSSWTARTAVPANLAERGAPRAVRRAGDGISRRVAELCVFPGDCICES